MTQLVLILITNFLLFNTFFFYVALYVHIRIHPDVYAYMTAPKVSINTINLVGTQINLQKVHMSRQERTFFFH